MRDTVIGWITGRDTFYLLGAGCSRCAGKPLIAQLTQLVVDDVGEPAEKIFKSLKPPSGREANIEDLMNHLIKRRDLIRSLDAKEKLGDLSEEDISEILDAVRQAIVQHVGSDWESSEIHANFLARVRQKENISARDIFTLNYDTILEATLDDLKVPYTDGFRGTGRAWFDPSAMDETNSEESGFRIHKLHGSVSWRRETDDHVRRYAGVPPSNNAVLVYPSEQKYVETRFGIYETLMRRFRDRMRALRPNNTLVSFGYSFNDEHINEAIIDAVCFKGSNLTLFAFVGPANQGKASDDQKAMFDSIHDRCGGRFNVFVGSDYARTASVEPAEQAEILALQLWRFEAAVDLVMGGPT